MDDTQRVGGFIVYTRKYGSQCQVCGKQLVWLIPPADRPALQAIAFCTCGYAATLERKDGWNDQELHGG
jgi:hypothetical protein